MRDLQRDAFQHRHVDFAQVIRLIYIAQLDKFHGGSRYPPSKPRCRFKPGAYLVLADFRRICGAKGLAPGAGCPAGWLPISPTTKGVPALSSGLKTSVRLPSLMPMITWTGRTKSPWGTHTRLGAFSALPALAAGLTWGGPRVPEPAWDSPEALPLPAPPWAPNAARRWGRAGHLC